jgi:hypothetical protein
MLYLNLKLLSAELSRFNDILPGFWCNNASFAPDRGNGRRSVGLFYGLILLGDNTKIMHLKFLPALSQPPFLEIVFFGLPFWVCTCKGSVSKKRVTHRMPKNLLQPHPHGFTKCCKDFL